MDQKIIDAFKESAISVLGSMAFVQAQAGPHRVKGDDERSTGDVSAIVGLTGQLEGSLSVSFSDVCICQIVSSMFGETIEELNEEVQDAVGELTNIISGDARRRIAELGVIIEGAVPMVVAGKGHSVRHMTSAPIVVIPFETTAGGFVVELCLAPAADAASRRP